VSQPLLRHTMELMGRAPAVSVVQQASGYRGRGSVFDYAVQPAKGHCFLGLGVRVAADGSLEFGDDSSDRQVLGAFLEAQKQVFLKTYTSALLMEAAVLCGYHPEVLLEGVPGEANRIALTVV